MNCTQLQLHVAEKKPYLLLQNSYTFNYMRALAHLYYIQRQLCNYTNVPNSRVCCQHVTTFNSRPTSSRSTRLQLIKLLQYAIGKISSFPRPGRSIKDPSFYSDRGRSLGNLRKEKCCPGYLTALDRRIHTYINIYVHTYINTFHGSLTLRRLMSYIYEAPILDVSRSHTTTQHSR